MKHEAVNPAIYLIGFWPLALLIIWAVWNSVRDSKNEVAGVKSIEWPETMGIVSSSQVVWAHVEVEFKYSVNSKEYIGKYKESLTQ